MKTLFSIIIVLLFYSCSNKPDQYIGGIEKKAFDTTGCPKNIKEKSYCDLYNKAKWYYYASDSHGKFAYRVKWGKLIVLEDILSLELELFRWREFNDTVEFTIIPARKYDLFTSYQGVSFGTFGFNKKNRELIYKVASQGHGKSFIEPECNGYIFYTGDKFCLLVDSICRSIPPYGAMRSYGIYPINEDDSILMSKIKSRRKDINPWLSNYAANFKATNK